MREALLYGLKRGVFQGTVFAVCLLLMRPSFELGQWVAEQALLLRHGGGDVWMDF